MSILPPGIRMYFDPELSMPLGAAKAKPAPVKVDPIREFEVLMWSDIREEDCRQVKRKPAEPLIADLAATSSASGAELIGYTPPSPTTPVAVPAFKVGDRIKNIRVAFPKPATVKRIDVFKHHTVVWYRVDGLGADQWAFDSAVALLPSEPKADAEGWIEWGEGDAPQGAAFFQVKRDDGSLFGQSTRNAISSLWNDPLYRGWKVRQQ